MKNLEKNSSKGHIFEENSGLFLENIFVPKIRLEKLIEDGNILNLSGLEQLSKCSKDSTKNNYLFIVFYSILDDLKSYSDKYNKSFGVWNITDLRENKSRLYIFGEVFEHLKNEIAGYLYLIINPSIITSDGKNYKSYLSITKANQVIKVGKVKGFTICKGINKNGTSCTNPIDFNYQGPFCKHHSSSRSENLKRRLNSNEKFTNTSNKENIKTDQLKSISSENKINYRRLINTNLNKTDSSTFSTELKPNRIAFKNENTSQNEIQDLDNKLNNAVKDNNVSEILNILRYLSNFDLSNISLDRLIKSGIIYSISNLELKTTDIETAIFALRIRHKLCNCKGYWPKITLKNPNENVNLSVPEMHLSVNWKDMHKKISTLEEKISKKEANEKSELFLGSVAKVKKNITKRSSNLNNIISKINQVTSLNTTCDDAIRKLEFGQIKKRLTELEEAEKHDEYKRSINFIKIYNAVKCTKCSIWTEDTANPICKEEHPESIVYNQTAIKESWLCKSCNERIYSINGYSNPYCPRCKVDTVCNLKRNSIYNLMVECPDQKKTLLVRDGEIIDEIKPID